MKDEMKKQSLRLRTALKFMGLILIFGSLTIVGFSLINKYGYREAVELALLMITLYGSVLFGLKILKTTDSEN